MAFNFSGSMVMMPLASASSEYGASIAARGLLRILRELGALDRQRVRHRNMSRNMHQEYRIVGRDFVQVQPVRNRFRWPARLVPALADDPFTGLVLRHSDPHTLLQLR